jgi:hypothetical protein
VPVAVNFINVKHTKFLYKHCFGSFYYVYVTTKKATEMTFVRKIRTFNVDEIDTRFTLILFVHDIECKAVK